MIIREDIKKTYVTIRGFYKFSREHKFMSFIKIVHFRILDKTDYVSKEIRIFKYSETVLPLPCVSERFLLSRMIKYEVIFYIFNNGYYFN